MVAQRHHIHANAFKLLILLQIQPVLRVDVFAVGDHQIDLFFLLQLADTARSHLDRIRRHHIANK